MTRLERRIATALKAPANLPHQRRMTARHIARMVEREAPYRVPSDPGLARAASTGARLGADLAVGVANMTRALGAWVDGLKKNESPFVIEKGSIAKAAGLALKNIEIAKGH